MFIFDPFTMLFDPAQRIFWPFVLGSIVIALLVGLWSKRVSCWKSGARFLFPARIWLHRSARLDYKLLFAKALIRALWIVPWSLSAYGLAVWTIRTLDQTIGAPSPLGWSSAAVSALYTLTLFLAWDLSRYVFHRLMHATPFLWELHKVHHSAEVLTPFTLYRTHPVESLLYSLRGIFVTGIVTGGFFYLFRGQAVAWQFVGINVLGFAANALGGNLRHSHIWLSYGTRIERYLLSPAQHQIHHSNAPVHFDRNFGTWLAIWDRLAGTLYVPKRRERLAFGLSPEDSNHREDSVISVLVAPLYSSIRQMAAIFAKPHRAKTAGFAAVVLIALAVSIAHAQEAADEPAPADPPTDAAPSESEPPTAEEPKPIEETTSTETPAASEPDDEDILIIDDDAPAEEPPTPKEPTTSTKPGVNIKPGGSKKPPKNVDLVVDTISILGTREKRSRIAGSAYKVGKKELEQFEYNDIHRVLAPAPGVYVRGEDGYGLRPNIGLRGASSERSAKLTLMEDGVLLGPAPYSAPAAYYFPLTSRMVGVEVFKGPASIRYGPNTIGGALNLQTRKIPRKPTGGLDVSVGQDRFGKFHGHLGTSGDRWGLLFEGIHLRTDGFKDLDNGADTGFDKSEFMLRGRYHSNPASKLYHQLDIKLGYAEETSNETYLGLSDADFAETPYRRYAASSLGLMDWDRSQVQLGYYLAKGEDLDLQVTAYRHDFSRSWRKLNRFRGGPELRNILANPDVGQSAVFFSVLTGASDSSSADQTLLIGTNDRSFVSQGISLVGHWRPQFGPVTQEIEVGARLHFDRIRRTHTEDGFSMVRQTLVPDGTDTETTTRNRGKTTAWAFYAQDEIKFKNLQVSPGIRMEVISSDFANRLTDTDSSDTDVVLIPGIGVHYQLTPWLGLLGGIHRGFSPVVPGQSDTADPEFSVNYEAGARADWEHTQAELIGYFNNYSNLTAICTLSAGCSDAQLDTQFDGGSVYVYGLEALLAHEHALARGIALFGRASYTLTLSEFQDSFSSNNPQFGDVTKGDELAYVPNHQLTISSGARYKQLSLQGSATYVGKMRDIAGQGNIRENEEIESHLVIDLAAQFQASKRSQIYLKVDNLLDRDYVVSRRPFGARPGRPLQLTIGFKFNTGG